MIRKPQRIWIIEDDPGSRFVLSEMFDVRYELRIHPDLMAFHASWNELAADPSLPAPDLLLADLRLPDGNFLDLLESPQGRALTARVRTLVVSSLDDVDVLRRCFELGARDYLTKPFGKAELMVKVERLLEEVIPASGSPVELDPMTLAVKSADGRRVIMTPKEYQILSAICDAGSEGISRKEILDRIWNSVNVNPNTFDVHLTHLRKKLLSIGVQIQHVASERYAIG
jgi:DNA-binding response OmpR family regulator